MGFEVAQLVAPLITAPAVSAALTVGATSYLVSTGEIDAAALVDLVELPAAFEIVIGAAAGAAAIGVVLGIGATEGAVKRDELRSTIRQGFEGDQGLDNCDPSSDEAGRGGTTPLRDHGPPLARLKGN